MDIRFWTLITGLIALAFWETGALSWLSQESYNWQSIGTFSAILVALLGPFSHKAINNRQNINNICEVLESSLFLLRHNLKTQARYNITGQESLSALLTNQSFRLVWQHKEWDDLRQELAKLSAAHYKKYSGIFEIIKILADTQKYFLEKSVDGHSEEYKNKIRNERLDVLFFFLKKQLNKL